MESAKSTPRDFFSYILMIATLYAGVVSFIALVFAYIEQAFPDALNFFVEGILDTIKRTEATLIVVWPVFLFVSWLVSKDIKNDAAKKEIKVRKWLLYLTIFLSAITIIVDLVTLIYNFLGGEITARFALKVVAVLASAAVVFGYYFWELKRDAAKKTIVSKIFAWAISAILIASIAVGFFIVGSPATQRAKRFDSRRVQDLQQIQSYVVSFWQAKSQLPKNLDQLNDSISGFYAPKDPQAGTPYEYKITAPLKFTLCADFKTVSNFPTKINYPAQINPDNWTHGAGHACFEREIDPKIYRPFENIPQPMKIRG